MLKSQIIAKILIQKCFSGEFKEGDLLPGEIDLCLQFNVSRSSIRAALQILSNKGIITIAPKKGSMINKLYEWHWLDKDILCFISDSPIAPSLIKSLLTARLTFEPTICAICALSADTEDLIAIHQGYELMVKGAQENNRSLFIQGDKLFHSSITKGCKNPFLLSLDNLLSAAMLISFNQTLEIDINSNLPALTQHKHLLDAICKKEAHQAKEISKKLILKALDKLNLGTDQDLQAIYPHI